MAYNYILIDCSRCQNKQVINVDQCRTYVGHTCYVMRGCYKGFFIVVGGLINIKCLYTKTYDINQEDITRYKYLYIYTSLYIMMLVRQQNIMVMFNNVQL